MNILKKTTLIVVITFAVIACKNKTAKTTQANIPTKTAIELAGDYVSVDYEKRTEGYDWVAVSVTSNTDSTMHVAIRSRVDIKKPTCTFDANATKTNDTTYYADIDGKRILFAFNDSTITIATEKEEESAILNYYCSGGGSLAGSYKKIKEPLDEKQIDPTVFNKTLSLQNIGFDISSTGKGSIQQLTILPFGLKENNDKICIEVMGTVTNAEIEDLNSDAFPEVLIYTTSAGSGSYGDVIGYSVNNGISLSRISFPNISENPKANEGYMGHDEFAIVENSLCQRFQVYKPGDSNSKPTGNIRQIEYKLKDGEASRIFVVKKIEEYPAK